MSAELKNWTSVSVTEIFNFLLKFVGASILVSLILAIPALFIAAAIAGAAR